MNDISSNEVIGEKNLGGRPYRFTPEEIISALQATNGMIYAAAKMLKTSSKTIRNYRKRFPEIEEAYQEIMGLTEDMIEGTILDEILIEKNDKLAMFYAKTKMKHRGYMETIKVESTIDSIAGAVKQLSDAELNELAARMAKQLSGEGEEGEV